MLVVAQTVQDLQLRGGQGQLAMLVLAVEADHAGAQVTQLGHRRGAPVDVRARASVGADPPSQDDLDLLAFPLASGRRTGGFVPISPKQLADVHHAVRVDFEHPLDVGLTRPGTHDPRARPSPEQQVERVGQHRLARSCLAGQYIQPVREAQSGAADQQQVLDGQLCEHRARCTSVRRRIAQARAGCKTPTSLASSRHNLTRPAV